MRLPPLADFIAAIKALFVVSIRTTSFSSIFPTGTVTAMSVKRPLCFKPKSILTMSPSCKTRLFSVGLPCTTSSLTDMQMLAGYGLFAPFGLKPRRADMSPELSLSSSFISRIAKASRSFVSNPARTASVNFFITIAWRRPPSRIMRMSSFVLMVIIPLTLLQPNLFHNILVNFFDRPLAVHFYEIAFRIAVIVLHRRHHFRLIPVQALLYLRLVIVETLASKQAIHRFLGTDVDIDHPWL